MRKLLLILLIATAMSIGCAAPANVQIAQKYQKKVLSAYASNNTKIFNTWTIIFERQYKAAIDATLETDIIIFKESLAANLSPKDLEDGIRMLVKVRDDEFNKMRIILAKMLLALETNRLEFVKAMEITENLNKWMNTGLDESAISGLTDSVLPILESALKLEGE